MEFQSLIFVEFRKETKTTWEIQRKNLKGTNLNALSVMIKDNLPTVFT